MFINLFEAIPQTDLYTDGFPKLHTISIQFNQFIRNEQFNEAIEILFTDMLKKLNKKPENGQWPIGLPFLKAFKTIGRSSEDMVTEVSKFIKLEQLEIRNCRYIEGDSLATHQAKNCLKRINLNGTDQLKFKAIFALLSHSVETIESLVLDGEILEDEQLVQLIHLLKSRTLKQFRLYFGQKLEDKFLLTIQSKLNVKEMTDFKLRKAN